MEMSGKYKKMCFFVGKRNKNDRMKDDLSE